MTHEAHDAGHTESDDHDCTYADRSRAERERTEAADRELAHAHRDERGRDFNDVEERRALLLDIRTARIDPDTGLFREAIGVPYKPAILDGPAEGLLRWARLGPWGPSILNLVLLRVKPRDGWLLATLRQHPVDAWFAVLGFVPNRVVTDREYVGRMVDRVIRRNGVPGHVLWKDHLPTHVRTTLPYFSTPELRELVFSMAGQLTPGVIRQAIDDLTTYRLDPWRRCEAEVRRALATPSHELALRGPFPDRALLEAWWERVTDPEHVRHEEAELDHAWVGQMAIAHHTDEEAA